jgi:hypothetical protein
MAAGAGRFCIAMRALPILVLLGGCHPAPAPAASSERACAAALPQLASQHTPNASSIYVAALAVSGDRIDVGAPVLATRKQGYVNQPAFLADGSGVYFTWRPEDSQADIWLRDLRTGDERPVTCSSEEEYVASRSPRGELTVVRVEPDLTRRLVVLGGDGKPRRTLFPGLSSVASYRWADDHTVALMNGEPDGSFGMALGDVASGRVDTVAHQVRAVLAPIPGTRAVSYVDGTDPEHLKLMSVDLATHETRLLLPLPDEVDSVAWLADGSMLAGRGARILRASVAAPSWREVASLDGKIDGPIARLVVSDDQHRIAIVTRHSS